MLKDATWSIFYELVMDWHLQIWTIQFDLHLNINNMNLWYVTLRYLLFGESMTEIKCYKRLQSVCYVGNDIYENRLKLWNLLISRQFINALPWQPRVC